MNSVPREVIRHIIKLGTPDIMVLGTRRRFEFLKSLCLINSTFYAIAQPLLFSHVLLSSTATCSNLYQTLNGDRQVILASWVRSLWLMPLAGPSAGNSMDGSALRSIIQICTNIDLLNLIGLDSCLESIRHCSEPVINTYSRPFL